MEGSPDRHAACPDWCTAAHGVYADELDDLHTGDELPLAAGVTATLCCSVDSQTQVVDGPYIVVGSAELTPEHTAEIGAALICLAQQASSGPGE